MVTTTDIKYIVSDPEVLGGRPIIAGHRIAVIHMATWIEQGQEPQEIAHLYGLSLAEIYAALTYYYDHKAELDAQAAEDDAHLAAYSSLDHTTLDASVRAAWQRKLDELKG